MQSYLEEAAYRICGEDGSYWGHGLNKSFGKACFVQGLASERIQRIVRAKGEWVAMSVCTDTALEESAILSVKERGI